MRTAQRSIVLASLLAGSAPAAVAAPPGAHANGYTQAAQKPVGAGVSIHYRLLDAVAIGRPTRVEILLGRITAPGGAVANLTAGSALQLDSAAGPYSFQAGRDGVLQVIVVPKAPGLAYLNVFVTQRGATSSTSIAIEAGADAAPGAAGSPGRLKELPEGDKIISMPVR